MPESENMSTPSSPHVKAHIVVGVMMFITTIAFFVMSIAIYAWGDISDDRISIAFSLSLAGTGASVATYRKYYTYLLYHAAESAWSPYWAMYNLTKPFVGMIAGTLAVFVLKAGLPSLIVQPFKLTLVGVHLIPVVGFVAGFASTAVLDRLQRASESVAMHPRES